MRTGLSTPSTYLPPRSYLYVPGDAADKLAKALDRGADALIVDLEDAVALARRARARQTVRTWLASLPPAPEHRVEIWVRINPGTAGHEDLGEILSPALHGVCVAKTESAEELEVLDRLLGAAERARGLRPGAIAVQPLLESAQAVLAVAAIAQAPRVERLQIGEADLAADLGILPGTDESELLFVRSQVVLVSAAVGLEPPVGPVGVDYADTARFRRSTLALRRLGFPSRACIHPAQVQVANEALTPSAEEVERARAVVSAFDAASARGQGVLADTAGHMIDEAVVRSSRRILAIATRRSDAAGR